MTFAQKKQTPRDVIHRTIMRDAYTRIARGEVLMDGEWIAPEEVTPPPEDAAKRNGAFNRNLGVSNYYRAGRIWIAAIACTFTRLGTYQGSHGRLPSFQLIALESALSDVPG